jgi:hypothetical protein
MAESDVAMGVVGMTQVDPDDDAAWKLVAARLREAADALEKGELIAVTLLYLPKNQCDMVTTEYNLEWGQWCDPRPVPVGVLFGYGSGLVELGHRWSQAVRSSPPATVQ